MTQARGPILNPGFYWIDSFTREGKPSFTSWLERSRGVVSVLNTSLHADEPTPREWILFQVKFPAPYTAADAAAFGFPTVAPRGAQTVEEDSRDAPAPVPGTDFAEQVAKFFQGSGLVGLGLLLFLLSGPGGRKGTGRSLF